MPIPSETTFDVGEDDQKGEKLMVSLTQTTRDTNIAHGVVYMYACPAELADNLEWVLARALGMVVKLTWTDQPLHSEMVQASAYWQGRVGTAAEVVSELRGWQDCIFEITEHAPGASDGSRFMYVPALGVIHQRIDEFGNTLLGEDAIRSSLLASQGSFHDLKLALTRYLGDPWNEVLEPYRELLTQHESIFVNARRNVG